MQMKQLGTNGPEVSAICFGAMELGGRMGPIEESQAIATAHAAIDAGVTFFDTAEGYATSEEITGKALVGKRDQVFLATKLSGEHSREHMTTAIESSLRALQTDHVDLYQLHTPRPERPIGETMADLLELRDQGKIRYIGVSNFSAAQHVEAQRYGPVHSSQPRYNMLWREAEEEVLPTCLDNGIGVIPHSPLSKGMLTGKYRPGHRFPEDDERARGWAFTSDRFEAAFPVVQKLSAWAGDHGRDIVQLAIAWTLAHPAVTSCIVGAKSREQAVHNASAADWELTSADMSELDEILDGFEPDGA